LIQKTQGIVISDLSKVFPKANVPALNNLSAFIKPGIITGLVGPDGAGKTTLLRHIAGILKPTNGTIVVNGFDSIKNSTNIHETTGYMPQKFGLYEDLSVHENLNLYADIFNMSKAERTERFEKLLRFTNMAPFQKRLAGKLSGGMKQKLGLSCALLRQPEVLLLDEPSVGVDPISRRELWSIVRNMVQDGTTVIWSTAYLDEAEQCEDVIALNEGNIIYTGNPQDIFKKVQGRVFESKALAQHKRETLQGMLKDENIIDGLIKGAGLKIIVRDPKAKMPSLPKGNSWMKAPPNFEDGFIDLLGGIQERHSTIAERFPALEHDSSLNASIEAKKLTKQFGDFTAAKNINFEVKQGEVFGILGPNGAGKSTTFKMLCGLLKPTNGSSSILGKDLRTAKALARQKIGYMAQKFSLYGNLTSQQNLSFFSGIYGLNAKESKAAIAEMIDTFDLAPYLNTPTEELPLGFKQRLALACAVMHHPKILFLDEPTSGVDPLTRREFWLHINGMIQKGVTVLVTTHFMDEAEYCDRMCLVYKGNIIALGTPDHLKETVQGKGEKIPTLEDTFIKMIERYDAKQQALYGHQKVSYDT